MEESNILNKYEIPNTIRKLIRGKPFCINRVGLSGSHVLMFQDMVLKIQDRSDETDNEYRVIKWLGGRIPTPEIAAYEISGNRAYCLMTRVPGEMVCSDHFMANPERLLTVVTKALMLLWNVDISGCPCDSTLDRKLKWARYNVENGLVDIENTEPGTFGENGFQGPEALLSWLEQNRPEEELVFSHGDFSMPNIFAQNDEVSGFIDLGRAGISDRWQDLAICHRSLKNNFAGKYNGGVPYAGYRPEMLFERLGIQVESEKLRYYILLDELF